MSELVSTRVRNTAGELSLPHLAEALTQYAQRADEAKMGYLDFSNLVLSEELAVRDDRRFRTGLRISKLPHHKTLDDYDFSSPARARPSQGQRPRHPFLRRSQGQRCPARAGRSGQDAHRRRSRSRGLLRRILDLLHQPRRHGPQPQDRRGRWAPDQPSSAAICGQRFSWSTRWATSPRTRRGQPGLPGHLKALRKGLDHPGLEQDQPAGDEFIQGHAGPGRRRFVGRFAPAAMVDRVPSHTGCGASTGGPATALYRPCYQGARISSGLLRV